MKLMKVKEKMMKRGWADKRTIHDIMLLLSTDKSSRKRVTRKLTSKRSTSLLISQEEQENNGHDDDGKEEDAKQPLGIKRVCETDRRNNNTQ